MDSGEYTAALGPINLEEYMAVRGWVWSETLGEYVDVTSWVHDFRLPIVEVTCRKSNAGDRC